MKPWEIDGVSEAEFWRTIVLELMEREDCGLRHNQYNFSSQCIYCDRGFKWTFGWTPEIMKHHPDCPIDKARTALKETELDEPIEVG